MEVLTPANMTEALDALAQPGSVAVAGGTALQVDWSNGVLRPARMVSLSALGLNRIDADGTALRIGATTTLSVVGASAEVARALPLLARAVGDVAAPGVRRLGTIGGQIGWGAGCLLPALLALGADVECAAPDGSRARVPLGDWLAAPHGLVLAVVIPPQSPGARWCWRKVGLRAAFTPSVIAVGGVAGSDGARMAAGGGAVRPQRLPEAEALFDAGADDAVLGAAIMAELDVPDCALRSARYRRRVAASALMQGLRGARANDPAPVHGPGPLPDTVPDLRRLTPDPCAPDPGDWHPRADLPDKIAGRAGYLTDQRVPDMLVGRILRAGRPHARILSIDTSVAEAMPGVRAVVTHRDVPGLNGFGIMRQDQPALASDRVRYQGDAVAAVAATDAETAEAALAAIRVDYDDLPPVTDPRAALAPDAPELHPGGNLVADFAFARGDAEAGLASAAHVVEETYVTPRQMHAFMETEGGWCAPTDTGLTVAVGGQHGARDQEQLSRILNLPSDRIRVITSPIGGGFGGKDELTVQPALALLALKAGAPVRLHLSRAESVLAGVKRNPMSIRMRTGCDADGRLVAQHVELWADCGAYASLSPAVVETALEHATGPYVVANVQSTGKLVYTNNGTCGAFRGFGANQMTFAIECQMDRLAALAGLDPVQIRQRNLRRPGMPGYLGHRVAGSERLDEMLAAAAASPLWRPTERSTTHLTATGMALNYQGNGLGSLPEDQARGTLSLAPDGAIEFACGLDEMGQGLVPALQTSVAAHLGCARSDVRVISGDTGRAPDAGSTSASRGGMVGWNLAARAAPGLLRALLALGAERLGCAPGALQVVPGGLAERARNSPDPTLSFADLATAAAALPAQSAEFAFPKTDYTHGNARFIHCFGATLARVAIDRISGVISVTDVQMHTAAGPVIDLAAYLGQIEGGVVQGLGLTLTEDTLYAGGRVVTRNLDSYVVPSVRDVPLHMDVTALESLDPDDPWGPRGVGELGIGALTPAIANAVGAALGRWPVAAPFQPETILELLKGSP